MSKVAALDAWRLKYKEKTPHQDLIDHFKGKNIVFCGLPGVGKSLLARRLAEFLGGVYYPEYYQEDLFQAYLADQKRYAFNYQMLVITHRIHDYKDALEKMKSGISCLIDGPFLVDNAFARMLWKDGKIADEDYELYQKILDKEVATQLPRPDYLVYLDGSKDIHLKRIKKRGRPGEYETYSKNDFLGTLRRTFVELLSDTEVIVLDYNEDNTDDEERIPITRLVEILGLLRDRTFQRVGLPEQPL